jgi:hypothetical protein
MVIAPANTGSDNNRRSVVIMVAHKNRGICSRFILFGRIFFTVVMKLIDPRIDEIPAKCREKIARSTLGPACDMLAASGGYTVQPVPTPFSTSADDRSKIRAGGRSQKLRLFIRGKAISGQPNINGINQFPNPPIKIGITRKKIIKNAWAVTRTLYS